MAEKSIEEKIDALSSMVEKGFAAVSEDIGDIRANMATKDQVFALQTQVNAIEQQLRETKTEIHLGHLEEKVFGASRR